MAKSTDAKTEIKAAASAEPVYTKAALLRNYTVFGTSLPIVATALRLTGKEQFTMAEAKKAIDTFRNKEVK